MYHDNTGWYLYGTDVITSYSIHYTKLYEVTFTEDGLTVLTANEGEPGSEKGAKDPRGSITVIELNTAKLAKSKSTTVDFVSFDSKRQELIDSGVILQKGKKPSTDLEPVYITTLGNIAYISLQEANAIAFFDLKSKIFTGIYSIGLQEFGPSFSVVITSYSIHYTKLYEVFQKSPNSIWSFKKGNCVPSRCWKRRHRKCSQQLQRQRSCSAGTYSLL